jgi:hypothetical protein
MAGANYLEGGTGADEYFIVSDPGGLGSIDFLQLHKDNFLLRLALKSLELKNAFNNGMYETSPYGMNEATAC